MHRGSTSKIKSSHLENPSRRIPCPACNWIIDDSRPDKHENHTWKHATTLGNSSYSKCDSDGCEHTLVYGEEEIGDIGGANGGSTKNISEANVLKIANVLAGGVREGERVTPEEPLEGDYGCGHN
jgi:hypothetical protein